MKKTEDRYEKIRDVFYNDCSNTLNVTTAERKKFLLENPSYVYGGHTYDFKFKNLGGGIWNMTAEPHFK